MVSSPSRYFGATKKKVGCFRSVRMLRGSFHWYCFCRTWQPCSPNWTDAVYSDSCPSEQGEDKSEFHEMVRIWHHKSPINSHQLIKHHQKIRPSSPPKKTKNMTDFLKPNAYYCLWLKSCTTWDVWNPINNGKNYLSTGAGFQPSTICLGWRLDKSFC